MDRFKKRHSLKSRRQTSCRVLPDDALELSVNFIQEVQGIIAKYSITEDNIHNLDQVPRYFENESTSTITTIGAKNVRIKKASSSHKKFTATFRVSATGQVFSPHALFSQLKNLPKVADNVEVDVNGTSMWSLEILRNYINKHYVSTDPSVHKLLILDAYPVHVKFVKEEAKNYSNLHFVIIPGNMTSLLQPLDVSINKSFQSSFRDSYNTYMGQAISDSLYRTKQGNIKVPTYMHVTQWINDWLNNFDRDIVKKSFEICGIVKKENFSIEKLHEPLRALMEDKITHEDWIEKFGDILPQDDSFFELEEHLHFWPRENLNSFFSCVRFHKKVNVDITEFIQAYVAKIQDFVETHDLSEMFAESEASLLEAGSLSGTDIEFFAISALEDWEITYIVLDSSQKLISEKVFASKEPQKSIIIIDFNGYCLTNI